MAKKLYVGNLAFSVTENALETLFSQIGTVEAVNLITDRVSGRSKGFGFVEMSTDDEAQKAISQLNGKEFEGRQLTVNEARPQQPHHRSGGFGQNRNGGYRGGGRYGGRRNRF